MVSYLYLSNFPSTSFIKYLVLSYRGEFVCVTDNEEVRLAVFGTGLVGVRGELGQSRGPEVWV